MSNRGVVRKPTPFVLPTSQVRHEQVRPEARRSSEFFEFAMANKHKSWARRWLRQNNRYSV